jgi:outer membrane beta-barrel protein
VNLLLVAAGAAALLSGPAAADEVIYGPDGAPTVVQNKLHSMSGLWEVGLRGVAAFNSGYVDHYGGMLSVSYHPNEWFDAGVDLFGNYTQLSDLAVQLRASNLPPRESNAIPPVPAQGDELANADQLRYGGFFAVRVAPIYGKMNLASELALHMQVYVLVGVGAGGIHHESVNLCAVAGGTPCQAGQFQVFDAVRAMGEVGGGLRVYLGERMSLLFELRALLFPATLKQLNDLTNPSSGSTKNYLGEVTNFAFGLARTF